MARPGPLGPSALAAALAAPDAPAWALVDGMLVKEVTCASFPAALDFVMAVGDSPRRRTTIPTSTSGGGRCVWPW